MQLRRQHADPLAHVVDVVVEMERSRVERHLELDALQVPLRLLVAPGESQEQVAGRGQALGMRQVDERAEGVAEPAPRKLSPEAERNERLMLCFVETVEHT